MRRILSAAVALALVSLGIVAGSMGSSGAMSKVRCSPEVGRARVDPIVSHGVAPSTHEHLFFGSTALLQLPHPESATYADLAGKGTNCANPGETAVYWIPNLSYTSGPNAGEDVPVASMRAYYRSWDHREIGSGDPFAPDTRLVAPHTSNTALVNWGCDTRSTRPGPFPDIATADCAAAGPNARLVAHVTFPTCWTGALDGHSGVDTSDSSQFAYRTGKGCPAGFDHKMAELRITVWFGYSGDGSDVALSSDMPGDAPGSSLHGDFWNTWSQPALVSLVQDCVQSNVGTAAECG